MTGAYLSRLLEGRASPELLSGPVRIAQFSHVAASLGFSALVYLSGVLSLSLGLTNLLPVPMLDGGHLLFYAVEAVRGRALSRRAQEWGLRIGLAFVLALTLFVTINDLWRLFGA
jgi:regulator of sigma E protease